MAKVTHLAVRGARKRAAAEFAGAGPASTAQFVREFRELGFTDYEAKAYLTLCRASPATAYEVSKISGLAKANTYSALEGLAQRGAVQPVSESPVKYVPVEPSRLLGQIAASTSARCKELVGKLDHLQVAHGTEYVWTVKGDQDIHAKISEMIDRARRHIWIKAPEHLLAEHIPALQRAARRGIKTVMILFGGKECLRRFAVGRNARAYLHEGSGAMIGPAHRLVTITIDFEEALTADTGEAGHGAFTRSAPVVHMAESLLRHEVYLAEIFMKFGPQIEKAFGSALLKLRKEYLPVQDLHKLKHSLDLA